MNRIEVPVSQDPRRIPFEGPILVSHQPEFFPYLGNIAKATMGDAYYIFDTAQFEPKHWQSRNKIRITGGDGWQWLIIPLKGVQKHILSTNEVVIDGDFWKKKHIKSINMSYCKAPYFKEIFPEIVEIYERKHELLVDFLIDIIRYAFVKFNINIPVYRTSDLIDRGYQIDGQKSDLVINMCRVIGAKTFVFGRDGRTYIVKETFYQAQVDFVFQEFKHPVYQQVQGGEFLPAMSFIDLLFNEGENAVNILGKSDYLRE